MARDSSSPSHVAQEATRLAAAAQGRAGFESTQARWWWGGNSAQGFPERCSNSCRHEGSALSRASAGSSSGPGRGRTAGGQPQGAKNFSHAQWPLGLVCRDLGAMLGLWVSSWTLPCLSWSSGETMTSLRPRLAPVLREGPSGSGRTPHRHWAPHPTSRPLYVEDLYAGPAPLWTPGSGIAPRERTSGKQCHLALLEHTVPEKRW